MEYDFRPLRRVERVEALCRDVKRKMRELPFFEWMDSLDCCGSYLDKIELFRSDAYDRGLFESEIKALMQNREFMSIVEEYCLSVFEKELRSRIAE